MIPTIDNLNTVCLKKASVIEIAFLARLIAKNACQYDSNEVKTKLLNRSFVGALTCPNISKEWFSALYFDEYRFAAAYRPQLFLKIYRVYMATTWNQTRIMKVILDTYKFVSQNEYFFGSVFQNQGVVLHQFQISNYNFEIHLGYDNRYRKEGEFVFSFKCNELGGAISAAAVSFEEINNKKWVMRIGCVQGQALGENNSSKIVQKLLYGIRPKVLIVNAIQCFSSCFNFEYIYGIGDKIHSYRKKHLIHLPWLHTISFDYDSLWIQSGGKLHIDNWYELPLKPLRKQISDIKSNKRSQYIKRFTLEDEIFNAIESAVLNHF